jgi:hypothetical protein
MKTKTGIPPGIEVGKKSVILKNHANSSSLWREHANGGCNLLVVDDDSSLNWLLKACNQSK